MRVQPGGQHASWLRAAPHRLPSLPPQKTAFSALCSSLCALLTILAMTFRMPSLMALVYLPSSWSRVSSGGARPSSWGGVCGWVG